MRIVVHLDGDSAGEVLVAVQKAGRPVQSVPSVICDVHVLIFVFPLNHIYSLIHLLQGTPSVFCAPHTEISTALLLSSGSMLPLLHELGNFHFNISWVTFYLGASFWFAFGLKLHCQTVEFHAKLPKIKSLRWWV